MKKFVRTRDFEVYAGIVPFRLSERGPYYFSVRFFKFNANDQSVTVATLRQAINLSIINFAIAVLKYDL